LGSLQRSLKPHIWDKGDLLLREGGCRDGKGRGGMRRQRKRKVGERKGKEGNGGDPVFIFKFS